jgi:hypothetical protein
MQFLANPANSTSKLAAYAALAWEVAHQRLVKTGLLGLGQEYCRAMNTYGAATYNVAESQVAEYTFLLLFKLPMH